MNKGRSDAYSRTNLLGSAGLSRLGSRAQALWADPPTDVAQKGERHDLTARMEHVLAELSPDRVGPRPALPARKERDERQEYRRVRHCVVQSPMQSIWRFLDSFQALVLPPPNETQRVDMQESHESMDDRSRPAHQKVVGISRSIQEPQGVSMWHPHALIVFFVTPAPYKLG